MTEEREVTIQKQKADKLVKRNTELRVIVQSATLNGSLNTERANLLKANDVLIFQFKKMFTF